MKEIVRTVRSGTVGLDLALGGGFRLVRRTQAGTEESATLLIRGGPGVGKSVLAQDLALRLAGALAGDALYVCVEVLPSEVIAQRKGFAGFDSARVVDLSGDDIRAADAEGPHLVLGMLDVLTDEDGVPDLGGVLLDLTRIARQRGFAPKAVVVDSLSDGYALGKGVPRPIVDGVCKLAAEQGWVLILVEEAGDDAPSPWAFAVDTVFALRLAAREGGAQTRRELLVTKHRFGACEPGPHRLQIEVERVRVIPPFSAYRHADDHVPLPPPATGRSLRVPVLGPEPNWAAWNIPDGAGRCFGLARGGASAGALAILSDMVAGIDANGGQQSGALVSLDLRAGPVTAEGAAFEVAARTLHEFVDGPEWLEGALARLCQSENMIARVAIGPVERLSLYEEEEGLRKGISLLARLLIRRGHVVVLYGADQALPRTFPDLVNDVWTLGKAMATGPRGADISVTTRGRVVFFPILDRPALDQSPPPGE